MLAGFVGLTAIELSLCGPIPCPFAPSQSVLTLAASDMVVVQIACPFLADGVVPETAFLTGAGVTDAPWSRVRSYRDRPCSEPMRTLSQHGPRAATITRRATAGTCFTARAGKTAATCVGGGGGTTVCRAPRDLVSCQVIRPMRIA